MSFSTYLKVTCKKHESLT